jgi:hypothetical protein
VFISKCKIKGQINFFFLWLYRPIQTLAASMKFSVSLQLLDLGQSVGLLGRVISLSQGLYLYTITEKPHTTQTLNIHGQSGIRTHGPGVRASEDSKWDITFFIFGNSNYIGLPSFRSFIECTVICRGSAEPIKDPFNYIPHILLLRTPVMIHYCYDISEHSNRAVKCQ